MLAASIMEKSRRIEHMFYDGKPMPRSEYFEIVAKSALNRVQHMGFNWSLNPYQGCFHSCVYCFARAHAKLADRDPGAGFSARVGVKVNLPELLRRELSSRNWKRDTVAFGTATDPYQPIEGTYKLTRRCLEAFRDFRTPIGLITKGTMVLRDIDVLGELSRRAKTTVCFSIPTVDEAVWAKTEPAAGPQGARRRGHRSRRRHGAGLARTVRFATATGSDRSGRRRGRGVLSLGQHRLLEAGDQGALHGVPRARVSAPDPPLPGTVPGRVCASRRQGPGDDGGGRLEAPPRGRRSTPI
jgi:hypothetical protein